jgi:hypothetical protein
LGVGKLARDGKGWIAARIDAGPEDDVVGLVEGADRDQDAVLVLEPRLVVRAVVEPGQTLRLQMYLPAALGLGQSTISFSTVPPARVMRFWPIDGIVVHTIGSAQKFETGEASPWESCDGDETMAVTHVGIR